MTHASLFSGIGGFDLAAEWMGWENVFHCEINEFCQKVLKHYWPEAKSYGDITKTDFSIWRGKISVLTGGFPCQPYSHAGKRLGKEDERHLWPEMLRAIREIKPDWIVGENVYGLVNWSGGLVFNEVQADLEAEGYEIFPFLLPASGVNAPHRRDRIWFVAYSNSNGQHERNSNNEINASEGRINAQRDIDKSIKHGINSSANSIRRNKINWKRDRKSNIYNKVNTSRAWKNFPTVSPICNGDDGLSSRLDNITFPKWRKESIKAGGNAIVPQVVYQIFKTINDYENL